MIPRDKLCSWPASAGILSLLLKNRENQPNCFVGLGCNPWGIKSRGTHCNSSWIAQGNPSPCFPLGKSVDLGFIGIYNPMPAAELWLIRGPFPKVGAIGSGFAHPRAEVSFSIVKCFVILQFFPKSFPTSFPPPSLFIATIKPLGFAPIFQTFYYPGGFEEPRTKVASVWPLLGLGVWI